MATGLILMGIAGFFMCPDKGKAIVFLMGAVFVGYISVGYISHQRNQGYQQYPTLPTSQYQQNPYYQQPQPQYRNY